MVPVRDAPSARNGRACEGLPVTIVGTGKSETLKGTPGTDVIVLSVDGEKAALEAINGGDMNATVECNPRFGPVAFDTLEKFRRGEKLPPKIINQDRFFDASNAKQFVGEAF